MNARSRLRRIAFTLVLICAIPLSSLHAQVKTKLRIATASPSLSYLPIYVAVKKGFFARRGFDVELIQMNASLTAPALLNRAVDYTTIPSAIATAAARGAPAKVIFFASVKLQHMLLARPEIANVNELAGKRIAAAGFGNLTSYEIQFLIEHYHLGPQTTIVSASSSTDRLIALQTRLAEAAIVASPLDLKGEEMGLKRLLHMGTILQIPQAGLAATDETIKNKRGEALEVLKASIEGLDYTFSQREPTIELIANWMALGPIQANKAYDSVKDTYSQNGIPTEEQAKAYIAMLAATAGVSAKLPSAAIFDFSLASAAAKELATKK
jgi:NitT/TauT family transport system substrate-binding protein